MNLDHDGQGLNRHELGKIQDHDFKELGEACVLSGPGDADLLYTALGATDSRNPCCQVCLMLEEVKMPPRAFLGIVNDAVFSAAFRTVEFASFLEVEYDI